MATGCLHRGANPYYRWPEILVLDPFAEQPSALVNLGQGDIQLRPAQPIVLPLYQCTAGETWTSEWVSEKVMVKAELRSLRSGEESCWFEGTVAVTFEERFESIPIQGACGC